MYGLSQWEKALQSNASSHWLSPYPEWSLTVWGSNKAMSGQDYSQLLWYPEEVHLFPDSKFHGANMGPTWVLSAPEGPHVGPRNLAIRVTKQWQIIIMLFQDVVYFWWTHTINSLLTWCQQFVLQLTWATATKIVQPSSSVSNRQVCLSYTMTDRVWCL